MGTGQATSRPNSRICPYTGHGAERAGGLLTWHGLAEASIGQGRSRATHRAFWPQ